MEPIILERIYYSQEIQWDTTLLLRDLPGLIVKPELFPNRWYVFCLPDRVNGLLIESYRAP
jgi:hypothetical protein